jgi:hypothetical protein
LRRWNRSSANFTPRDLKNRQLTRSAKVYPQA